MTERKPTENARRARLTGPLKDGFTIADVMDEEDAYQHVLHELVATFDRLTERLSFSELQEEQTEIASALAQLGTAIMLHRVTKTLKGIERALPESLSYIAESLSEQEG